MKVLILFGVIAAALAAPLPDEDCDLRLIQGAMPYAGFGYAGANLGYAGAGLGFAGAGFGFAAPAPIAEVAYAEPAPIVPAPIVPAPIAPVPIAPAAIAPASIAEVAYAAPAPIFPAAIAPAAIAPAPIAPAAIAPAAIAPAPIAPAPISYAVPTPVALPPAEVKIPITRTHVEVPVHQQVHYGTQSYVAGSTTSIHKPALAAAPIAPPTTLISKVTHNAPQVTIKEQEIPVERHTPNFVETPYHAGTIIEYTEPEIREVKVPTPYAQPVPVPHPVPVAEPVPVPTPVHSVAVHGAAPIAAPLALGAVVAAADC